MMFTAASTTNSTLRDELIAQIHAYASVLTNVRPFEVMYNPITGEQLLGSARFVHFLTKGRYSSDLVVNKHNSPAQGAMFALLAIE